MTSPRTKIRMVVADLTVQDGRITGYAALSVTEGGRTQTAERRIDTGAQRVADDPEARFLAELRRRGAPVAFAAMDSWATPGDSRARQRCKRNGWAVVTKDARGRRAWSLTETGRRALDRSNGGGDA